MSDPFRPFIVVRLIPAVYTRVAGPDGATYRDLLRIARDIVAKKGHRCCVVIAPDRCLYLERDGSTQFSRQPPSGGLDIVAMTRPRPPQRKGPGRLPK